MAGESGTWGDRPILSLHSDYLDFVFQSPEVYQEHIETATARVLQLQEEYGFTALAFMGISGAALAFPIAAATNLSLICVRKDCYTHAYVDVEMTKTCRKYAIIDDVIDSGDTVDIIRARIKHRYRVMRRVRGPGCSVIICVKVFKVKHRGVPVRSLLYNDRTFDFFSSKKNRGLMHRKRMELEK